VCHACNLHYYLHEYFIRFIPVITFISNYYLQEYFPRVPGLAPDIQGSITGMYKVKDKLV